MLTGEQLESYRRDGFLVVPGAIAPRELALLQEAADRITAEAISYGEKLDAEGPIELSAADGFWDWNLDESLFLYAQDDTGRRVFRRSQGMWARDPIFRATTAHPLVLDAVRKITAEDAVPYDDAMVVKMPGAGAAVPWHRDPPGPPLIEKTGDATPDFTLDIYLDASTVENGCVWGLPGSHRAGGPTGPEDPMDFDVPGAVPLEAQPGDLLLHSTGVLHGSPRNTSGQMRRTFYLHFRNDSEERLALADAVAARRALGLGGSSETAW
jgi:phytanoyl-CoA hydroxylase